MKAQSTRSVVRFVCAADKKLPVEKQSVVLLKPLTIEEQDIIEDAYWRISEDGTKRRASFSSKCSMAFNLAVTSIENFENEDGTFSTLKIEREEIPDEFGVYRIKAEIMELLPKSFRDEIALAVLSSLNPTVEERKN